jgi:DNA-directed RNA polymerase
MRLQQEFQHLKNLERQKEVSDRLNEAKEAGTYSIGPELDNMVRTFSEHLKGFSKASSGRHGINKMVDWLEGQFESDPEMWISRKTDVFDLLSLITVEYVTARVFIGMDRQKAILDLSGTYKLELAWCQLLIEEFCVVFSDRIERTVTSISKTNKIITITASAEFLDKISKYEEQLIMRQKTLWPMMEQPQDWTGFIGNPYRDPLMSRKMVRKGSKFYINVETACKVLNNLQKNAYKINETVLDAAKKAYRAGELDVFKSKQYSSWEERRKVRGGITAARRKIREIFSAATFFAENDQEFYIPYCIDYRGRVYPMNTVLSSQGSELEKALHQAATPTKLGSTGGRELLIQLATTFGSKDTLDARIKFSQDLLESGELERWLSGESKGWQDSEEPFLALATAEALVGWKLSNYSDDFKTGVLVFIDASNSGFQLCAGMLRDENLAPLVNLTPNETVGDLYTKVAEEVSARYDGPLKEAITQRKVWKRPVMCLLYSLTFIGAWKYIDAAIGNSMNLPEDEYRAEITKVTHIFFKEAMPAVAPQGFKILGAIQGWSRKLVKHPQVKDSGVITWTAPAGMTVHQRKKKVKKKEIKSTLSTDTRVKHIMTIETDDIDANGHTSSIVPNVIHSIDASLLWTTVNTIGDLGHCQMPCHDAFSTTAGQAAELGNVVRNVFIELVESNPLERIKEELEYRYDMSLDDEENNLPQVGNLNLTEIINTDHSFR